MASLKRKLAVLLAVCTVVMNIMPTYAAGKSKQPEGNTDAATPSNAEYVIRFQNTKKGYTYDILPYQSVKASTICQKMAISKKAVFVESPNKDFIEVNEVVDSYGTKDWEISINQESTLNAGQLDVFFEQGFSQIDVLKIALNTKSVGYTNEEGEIEYQDCIIISGKNTNFWFEPGKWYSFEKSSSVDERIINLGTEAEPAYLILADSSKLEANAGIENHSGNALVIYGGKRGTGRLIARGWNHDAGIGGSEENSSGGVFTLYGGTLDVTGATYFAAIGGGRDINSEEAGDSGVITINGGTVNANGGKGAAAIGTSEKASSLGNITVREDLEIFSGSSKKDLEKTTLEQYLKSRDRYVKITSTSSKTSSSSKSGSSIKLFTGTQGNPVNGTWTQDSSGVWHFTSNGSFRNTWGYIVNPYAQEGQNAADWFWFDANGNMLTGWQLINGKWYYLNPSKDGTLGACLIGPGRTPDGYEIDETGAWVGR